MMRSTDSEIRGEGSEGLVKLLSHFKFQQDKDEYSIEQFITFLQFIPLQQDNKSTIDERATIESNHRVMLNYLREKLSQNKSRSTFTLNDLIRILDKDSVDTKLLAGLFQSQNNQDVLTTVAAFIKPHTKENKDEQDVLNYLKTFVGFN